MDLDNEELMETKKDKGLLKKETSERCILLVKLRKELDDIVEKGIKLSEFSMSEKFRNLDKKEQFYMIRQFHGMAEYKQYLEMRINYIKKELYGDEQKTNEQKTNNA